MAKKKMEPKEPVVAPEKKFLSSGSTLLNLNISNHPDRAFLAGHTHWLVGDSSSGKTMFGLSMFAEAALSPDFKGYRFIYDDTEKGCQFDLEAFFGQDMALRLEPPRLDKETGFPAYSEFLEDFYFSVDDAIKDGRPFIYILDSIDGLDSIADSDKFEKDKSAHRSGKELSGSYGMSRAKLNSSQLRRLATRLEESGSLVFILSQTRTNPGFGYVEKTTAGGKALEFYATTALWFSRVKALKKTVEGQEREVGQITRFEIKKNRVTGQRAKVELPLYITYGLDDLRSCVDYLVDEDVWTEDKQSIVTTGLPEDLRMTKERLLIELEEKGWTSQVKALVVERWNQVREAMMSGRKPKYAQVGTGD